MELVAALTEIEYMEKPKLLFFAVNNGRRVSCINQLQTVGTEQGTLSSGRNLSGTGVIVAVIDSGIDYTHPDFSECRRNHPDFKSVGSDDTSRQRGRSVSCGEWRNVIFRGTVRVHSWN